VALEHKRAADVGCLAETCEETRHRRRLFQPLEATPVTVRDIIHAIFGSRLNKAPAMKQAVVVLWFVKMLKVMWKRASPCAPRMVAFAALWLGFTIAANDLGAYGNAPDIDPAVPVHPALEPYQRPRGPAPSLGRRLATDTPIWRTTTLGTYTTIDAVRNALDVKRIHVGDTAKEILDRPAFKLSKTKLDARLVVLAVSELGFDERGASLADIYARARQLGLKLCPAEVGPQLRLQYLRQPLGEFLHIAMEPIAGDGGEPADLTVANGGAGLILVGGEARPNLIMPSVMRFVFVGAFIDEKRMEISKKHDANLPPAH
jgi:hypothetical protein